jgi:hypothetical protein
MSVSAIIWAIQQRHLTKLQRLVLIEVALAAGAFGCCFPNAQIIAQHCCSSAEDVREAWRELERQGLLIALPDYRGAPNFRLRFGFSGLELPNSTAAEKS